MTFQEVIEKIANLTQRLLASKEDPALPEPTTHDMSQAEEEKRFTMVMIAVKRDHNNHFQFMTQTNIQTLTIDHLTADEALKHIQKRYRGYDISSDKSNQTTESKALSFSATKI